MLVFLSGTPPLAFQKHNISLVCLFVTQFNLHPLPSPHSAMRAGDNGVGGGRGTWWTSKITIGVEVSKEKSARLV